MENPIRNFASAWNGLWGGESPEFSEPVALPDTAAYPLARTVAMPDGHPYESGALGFRMTDLGLRGVNRLDGARSSIRREGDRLFVNLILPDVTLEGRCSVEVKPDPIVTVDHGGDLMDLPPEQCRPISAGASGAPPIDPQKEEWLNNARDQRARLATTENGQKMLGAYSEHNEIYDELFRTSSSMQTSWQAGGVTKQMAADTSASVKSQATINDKEYTPTDGSAPRSYNGNAFTQQTAVVVNTLLLDPNFDPFSESSPPPAPKYMEASRAAASFSSAVQTTGNTKTVTTPVTSEQVYHHVNTATGEPQQVSDSEMLNVLAQGPDAGGGPATLGARVLDEEDRALIRNLVTLALKERAEKASVRGTPLFGGTCAARIGEVRVTIEMALHPPPARTVSAVVDLPAFELVIDDSAWTGEAGRVASGRVERMLFIRSLLCDSISARLQRVAGDAAETAYRNSTLVN